VRYCAGCEWVQNLETKIRLLIIKIEMKAISTFLVWREVLRPMLWFWGDNVITASLAGTLQSPSTTVNSRVQVMCGVMASHCGRCIHLVINHMMIWQAVRYCVFVLSVIVCTWMLSIAEWSLMSVCLQLVLHIILLTYCAFALFVQWQKWHLPFKKSALTVPRGWTKQTKLKSPGWLTYMPRDI